MLEKSNSTERMSAGGGQMTNSSVSQTFKKKNPNFLTKCQQKLLKFTGSIKYLVRSHWLGKRQGVSFFTPSSVRSIHQDKRFSPIQGPFSSATKTTKFVLSLRNTCTQSQILLFLHLHCLSSFSTKNLAHSSLGECQDCPQSFHQSGLKKKKVSCVPLLEMTTYIKISQLKCA